ncbi:MAG: hypothetical protein AAF063_22610 [Cyanobacteria bacterium J06643_5]
MKIRVQGTKKECMDGVETIRKNFEVLNVSIFFPSQHDFHIGVVFIELKSNSPT